MSILSKLQKAGGCAGGTAIYFGAKAACEIINIQRKDRELWPNTKKLFRKYLPKIDYNRVRFHIWSSLPGNWFTSSDSVEGMTFGYNIFFKATDYQKTRSGLGILMHELVHVDQVRRFGGEHAFACKYGQGYLKGGSYRSNPLEQEAYEFVAEYGAELPDGVSKN